VICSHKGEAAKLVVGEPGQPVTPGAVVPPDGVVEGEPAARGNPDERGPLKAQLVEDVVEPASVGVGGQHFREV
jgi:hypothetical protein